MSPRTIALLIAAILTVSACSSSAPIATPTPIPTPVAGKIAWTSCGGGFQCGTVQVPLDYSHPTSGTIDIALNRKPATIPAQRIGSLLINPGGPGASGIDWIAASAPAFAILNRKFDLVGFDPRGIGRSAPVRCLDGPSMDTFVALDGVLDDSQEKAAAIQADKDFAAGCGQLSGRVLPFVDTASAARDMDVMRAALGDDTLTYLGFSYGTYLGEWYAHLFPTHIRAIVLDAVLDPSLSADDLNISQAASFDQNLKAFLADCNAHKAVAPKCAFAQSGDPASKLNAMMQRFDVTPLAVGNRALTRALAQTAVAQELYDQSTWPDLALGLTQADQGHGSVLMGFADSYLKRHADGTYDNEIEANYAVNCLDHPALTDISAYDKLGPAYARASSFFGPSFQYSNLPCTYWPATPTGHAGPLTADGAPPILMVGGTNDPATPYAWAVAAHKQLAGSILVTRNGNGHGSYGVSICATIAEINYLLNLQLPAEGTVCSS
ncbi:MAG TPA: alpha/beta hydrolase [Candidatus Dormibacteraeota bacterium]